MMPFHNQPPGAATAAGDTVEEIKASLPIRSGQVCATYIQAVEQKFDVVGEIRQSVAAFGDGRPAMAAQIDNDQPVMLRQNWRDQRP
jgi:hypothetical protein